MKTLLVAAILISSVIAHAENGGNHASGSLLINTVALAPDQTVWTPRDPVRQVGNQVFKINGVDNRQGWVEFSGKVWDVQPGGVCIRGYFTGSGEAGEFFVTNFPYAVGEGQMIERDEASKTYFCARLAGTHSYHTVAGGTMTLRQLDYCQVYAPPAQTPEQAEAAKARVELAKQTAREKALKYDMSLAATNDAYGLERMGERYRDGEGVDKDPAKAKEYFQNAVTAGSPTAVDKLKQLTEK